MKKIALLLQVVLIMAAALGCAKTDDQPAKPKIAVTLFPLYDIIRNIAGDKVDVVSILPPGASPHTYELTPQRVEQLEGIKLVFRIGHGLDDWASNIPVFIEKDRIIVVDKGIDLIHEDEGANTEAPGQAHAGANPHYWLSIGNAQLIAGTVAEELARLDAENAQTFRQNQQLYVQKLQELKSQVTEKLKPFKGAQLITFHDAWSYYAAEFGLEIAATIEPFPGKQPTPRYLAHLQQVVQQYQIQSLFIEPQLSSESVEAFVADLGLRLYTLDPLGGVEGRESYIDLMQYNTNIIVEALTHESR